MHRLPLELLILGVVVALAWAYHVCRPSYSDGPSGPKTFYETFDGDFIMFRLKDGRYIEITKDTQLDEDDAGYLIPNPYRKNGTASEEEIPSCHPGSHEECRREAE
jgi:hypothetical protein